MYRYIIPSLMQDIVYHHLPSREKILQNQVNEPNLHVRILLYCILLNEYRIVPARRNRFENKISVDQFKTYN